MDSQDLHLILPKARVINSSIHTHILLSSCISRSFTLDFARTCYRRQRIDWRVSVTCQWAQRPSCWCRERAQRPLWWQEHNGDSNQPLALGPLCTLHTTLPPLSVCPVYRHRYTLNIVQTRLPPLSVCPVHRQRCILNIVRTTLPPLSVCPEYRHRFILNTVQTPCLHCLCALCTDADLYWILCRQHCLHCLCALCTDTDLYWILCRQVIT